MINGIEIILLIINILGSIACIYFFIDSILFCVKVHKEIKKIKYLEFPMLFLSLFLILLLLILVLINEMLLNCG